jgi:hypothetical protein
VTGRLEFSLKLILDLLRRRTWLIAVAITLVSFLLGAAALGTGQLAAVQIIILELPLTLIGGAKFLGSRLGRREWAAVGGLTGGVIGLLACLDPQSGPTPISRPRSGSSALPPPAARCWCSSCWPGKPTSRTGGPRCSASPPGSGSAWPPLKTRRPGRNQPKPGSPVVLACSAG